MTQQFEESQRYDKPERAPLIDNLVDVAKVLAHEALVAVLHTKTPVPTPRIHHL